MLRTLSAAAAAAAKGLVWYWKRLAVNTSAVPRRRARYILRVEESIPCSKSFYVDRGVQERMFRSRKDSTTTTTDATLVPTGSKERHWQFARLPLALPSRRLLLTDRATSSALSQDEDQATILRATCTLFTVRFNHSAFSVTRPDCISDKRAPQHSRDAKSFALSGFRVALRPETVRWPPEHGNTSCRPAVRQQNESFGDAEVSVKYVSRCSFEIFQPRGAFAAVVAGHFKRERSGRLRHRARTRVSSTQSYLPLAHAALAPHSLLEEFCCQIYKNFCLSPTKLGTGSNPAPKE
ncbi:hypothetical protein PMIN06_003677 [Paraphaeosphaeria minitans]